MDKGLWIKISEVAKQIGVDNQTVRLWCRAGYLTQVGPGRRLRYVTRESFEQFLERHSNRMSSKKTNKKERKETK